MPKKLAITMISLATVLVLSACGDNSSENSSDHESTKAPQQENGKADNHAHMQHSSDGELPEGLKVASNPKFPVGSTAIMKADHMEGMNGEEATIVGAFDTTVYAVSYTPTNGGSPVENHKWVVYEELQLEDNEPIKQNSKVVLNADHMEGMQGATATIDSVEETTVYMVNYTSSTGEKVENHKWVTESELVKK